MTGEELHALRDELVELTLVKCCDPGCDSSLGLPYSYDLRLAAFTAVEYTIAMLTSRGDLRWNA